jgi:tRNA/rRNA methyltransferase
VRSHLGLPATRADLVGLFEHLERELDAAEYLFPPEKRETMVRNIRAMILRSGLTDQQARTIRGMIVALVRNKYRGKQ